MASNGMRSSLKSSQSVAGICRLSYPPISARKSRIATATPFLGNRHQSSSSSSAPIRHPSKPPLQAQPLHSTHPHLLKAHELTLGIPSKEYEERRRRLMGKLPEGSKVICMGGGVRLVTQPTDFFYLTGFTSPDSVVILETRASAPRGYTYTLYIPPSDSHDELWDGASTSFQTAIDVFGADEVLSNEKFKSDLPGILSKAERKTGAEVYVGLPPSSTNSMWGSPYPPSIPNLHSKTKRRSALSKILSAAAGDTPTSSLWSSSSSSSEPPHLLLHASLLSSHSRPLAPLLESQRLIKSPSELSLMSQAAQISARAHTKIMRGVGKKDLKTEHQVASTFEWHCKMEGSEREAYVPVVASGENATVIHYTKNDCVLEDGELLLIDAGCELGNYASDITRTFPVSGRFTEPQKDLYQAVLNVQKDCIKKCKVEDEIGMNELHRFSCTRLAEELRQIGFKLNTGDVERNLYPHFLTHHLGSDLHDCPTQDKNSKLLAGQVITIEPGIYVPPSSTSTNWPKAFRGMGIRIEDEVAFTKDGPWVLSSHAPKEVVDVEGTCQGLLEET